MYYFFFKKILHAAFSQRRKILSNSWKKMGIINIQEILYNIGINPTSRAEQVSPNKYVELARVLHSKIQISNISNIY